MTANSGDLRESPFHLPKRDREFSYFHWINDVIVHLDALGNTPEALLQAQHFASTFPGYPQAEAELSMLLSKVGMAEKAVDRISTSLERDKHSSSIQAAAIATTLMHSGESKALGNWEKLLSENVNPLKFLAPVIFRLTQVGELAFASALLQSFPQGNDQVEQMRLSLRGLLTVLSGDPHTAIELINAVGQKSTCPPGAYFVTRTLALLSCGYIHDAQLYAKLLVQGLGKSDFELRRFVSHLLLTLPHIDSADDNSNEMQNLQRDTWSYEDELIKSIPQLIHRKLFNQALFQCDRLRSNYLKRKEAQFFAAMAELELGAPNAALTSLTKIGVLSEPAVIDLLSRALLELGRFDELLSLLKSPAAATFRDDIEFFSILDELISMRQIDFADQMLALPRDKTQHAFEHLEASMRILARKGFGNVALEALHSNAGNLSHVGHYKILVAELENSQNPSPSCRDQIINLAIKNLGVDDTTLPLFGANSLCSLGLPDDALRLASASEPAVKLTEARALIRKTKRYQLPKREKLVVFLAPIFRTRFAKMARSLRKHGWNAVLITADSPDIIPDNCFDSVHILRDPAAILALTASYRPQVCHVSTWVGDELCTIVLREKLAKTVFDPTDYGSGIMTHLEYAYDELYQNEALSLADGLCSRDLRPQILSRDFKIPLPKRVLYFADYCWDEPGLSFLDKDKLDGIHLVSVGGIVIKKVNTDLDYGYSLLAQKLADNGIHLHIYPATNSVGVQGERLEEEYKWFIELGQKTGFIHVNKPLRTDEIPKAIAKFHFGVQLYLPTLLGVSLEGFTYPGCYLCGCARFTDYIDAGLNVCYNSDYSHHKMILERGKVGVPITKEFLENPRPFLEHKLQNSSFDQVAAYRKKLSTDAHVHRLIRFYESL